MIYMLTNVAFELFPTGGVRVINSEDKAALSLS